MQKHKAGDIMNPKEEHDFHSRVALDARYGYRSIQEIIMNLGLRVDGITELLREPSSVLLRAIEKAELRMDQINKGE